MDARTAAQFSRRVRQIITLRYKEKYGGRSHGGRYANKLLEDMTTLRVRTEAGAFSQGSVLLEDYLLLISVRVMLRGIEAEATPLQKAQAIISDIQFVLGIYGLEPHSESEIERLTREFTWPLSRQVPYGQLGVLGTTIYAYCKIKVLELWLIEGNQQETLRILRLLAINCEHAQTYAALRSCMKDIAGALRTCQLQRGANDHDRLMALIKEVWDWIGQLLTPLVPIEEFIQKQQ